MGPSGVKITSMGRNGIDMSQNVSKRTQECAKWVKMESKCQNTSKSGQNGSHWGHNWGHNGAKTGSF